MAELGTELDDPPVFALEPEKKRIQLDRRLFGVLLHGQSNEVDDVGLSGSGWSDENDPSLRAGLFSHSSDHVDESFDAVLLSENGIHALGERIAKEVEAHRGFPGTDDDLETEMMNRRCD